MRGFHITQLPLMELLLRIFNIVMQVEIYYLEATSGAIYGSIDNVSVKEVGQDWILTQSTIGNEEATIISTDGSYAGIKQNGVFDTSKIYFYSFNVKSITGTVQFRAGTNGVNFTTTGLITGYIKPTSSGTLEIKRIGGPLNATITNISVKEVGQDWTFGTGVIVGDGFVEMDDSAALATRGSTNWSSYKW